MKSQRYESLLTVHGYGQKICQLGKGSVSNVRIMTCIIEAVKTDTLLPFLNCSRINYL